MTGGGDNAFTFENQSQRKKNRRRNQNRAKNQKRIQQSLKLKQESKLNLMKSKFTLPLNQPLTFRSASDLESTTPEDDDGGYKAFASQYPQLCDSTEGMARLSQSLSQPCLSNPNGDGITLITPLIYLGSQMDSLDEKMLKGLGITAVINLSVTCPQSVCIEDQKNFMRIPVNDSYQEKLQPFFNKAYDFLERLKKEGRKCLIHCLAGISRSPTLCISYIMRSHRIGSEAAYKYVKERRPSISPNFNFMGQLLEYEHQLMIERVLRPDQASRPYRAEKPHSAVLTECNRNETDLSPPKVPKSASSHCVFPSSSPSASDTEQQFSDEPSNQINANGKRGMSPDLPRPKALPFLSAAPTVRQELASPSTELSRLSFDTGATTPSIESQLAFCNPCFMPPVAPSREMTLALGSASQMEMENPTFYHSKIQESSEESASSEASTSSQSQSAPVGSNLNGFRFKKGCTGQKASRLTANRPECLRSSGVLISSSPLLATTEEEVESPESGFNEEEMKSSPEEDDTVSMGSGGSTVEITCL